jgi:hypothetical protein
MRTFADVLGPDKDVAAPDMGTDSQTMAWMFKRYTELCDDRTVPGIVTGKPVELFGSHGRTEATGYGLATCVANVIAPAGVRVIVEGFGRVGMYAALRMQQLGAGVGVSVAALGLPHMPFLAFVASLGDVLAATLVGVPVLAMAASWVPTVWAAAQDPATILREE